VDVLSGGTLQGSQAAEHTAAALLDSQVGEYTLDLVESARARGCEVQVALAGHHAGLDHEGSEPAARAVTAAAVACDQTPTSGSSRPHTAPLCFRVGSGRVSRPR